MGCSCDPALPPLSLSLPAALSSHLNELSAIPAIIAQQLHPRNMVPFMCGSAVLVVYCLQNNTWLGVIVNMASAWT